MTPPAHPFGWYTAYTIPDPLRGSLHESPVIQCFMLYEHQVDEESEGKYHILDIARRAIRIVDQI